MSASAPTEVNEAIVSSNVASSCFISFRFVVTVLVARQMLVAIDFRHIVSTVGV